MAIYCRGSNVAEIYRRGTKVLQVYKKGALVYDAGGGEAFGGYIREGLVLQLDCSRKWVEDVIFRDGKTPTKIWNAVIGEFGLIVNPYAGGDGYEPVPQDYYNFDNGFDVNSAGIRGDFLTMDVDGNITLPEPAIGKDWTVEICFKPKRVTTYESLFNFSSGYNDGRFAVGFNVYTGGDGKDYLRIGYTSIGGDCSAANIPLDQDTLQTASCLSNSIRYNGSDVEVYDGGQNFNNELDGRNFVLYSIRVYNRPLTDEERRHNRQKDIENFDNAVPTNAVLLNGGEPLKYANGDFVTYKK